MRPLAKHLGPPKHSILGWLAAASFNGFAQLLKNHRELRQNCHIGNPVLDVMSRRTAQKSMFSGHCPGAPRAPFPEFRGPATGPKADECSSNIAPPQHTEFSTGMLCFMY